jgi:hypothetical protein
MTFFADIMNLKLLIVLTIDVIFNYLIKIIRTLLVPRRTFVWTLTLTNTNTLKIITVKMAWTPGKN